MLLNALNVVIKGFSDAGFNLAGMPPFLFAYRHEKMDNNFVVLFEYDSEELCKKPLDSWADVAHKHVSESNAEGFAVLLVAKKDKNSPSMIYAFVNNGQAVGECYERALNNDTFTLIDVNSDDPLYFLLIGAN